MGERRQLHRLAAVWLLLLAALACHARPQDGATTKPEADNAITSGALPATTTVAPKEKEVSRDVSNSGGVVLGTRRWSPRRGSPALGPSIASVAGQLLEDTRTPPLVQQLRAQAEAGLQHGGEAQPSGQGEAVPVLLEEHELADERRVQQIVDRTHGAPTAGTTRPEPGISTWVLLSGSNSSPAPEEPSSTTTTTTTTTSTTAAPVKNNKKGGGKPTVGSTSTTTAAAAPQKGAGGGGRKPAPGGGQTPRPPPSTAANNKFVQQFRPLLHSRPANPVKAAAAATETSTASPKSTTTTTSRTTTTRTTTTAASTTKKPPKTTTTTTTTPPPVKPNRTTEPEGVQLLPALTRQPPPKAKPAPSPAAPTAAAFRRRPAANNTTAPTTTTTTTAAPQPTVTTAQPPAKATTSKVKTTTTTSTSTTTTTPLPVTTVSTRGPEEPAEDATETSPEESTTKRQRRPTTSSGGGKKRKKNKNKRRKRPTAQQDQQPAESKVTEVSPELKSPGNATRPAGNKEKRPLSTRIYNYLAREVMPSVGVGLIGLVVTAGLAGLMLYPFGGGVAARRTYEEEESAHRLRYPHQGGFLYYEGAGPDGKPEEAVLREVFEGMAPVDEPVSSYHQPQGNDDSDVTYSYSAGPAAPGYSGHQYSGSYAAMASSTTPPPGGQAGPYYSGHADTSSEYRRPQYHQRLEATPKHAATAASPAESVGSMTPEKFYGSEAVHVRTADVPKYSALESSHSLSGEHQEKAIGYSVVSAGDRVGTVELSYGGRVRHHQVGEASSAIAEHGPRSLDTVTGERAQTTEATRIETRKRRDITEIEAVSPDSLLADNDIDVVWAKEKKWPPKKEVGGAKQPVKWMKADSSPAQGLKASALEGSTSTNSPLTTEFATLPSEAETRSSTEVSFVDTDVQTTTDQARLSEDTTGEPAVTEVITVTEESLTEAPLNSSDVATLSGGPAVEEFPTNSTGDSPASGQQNQRVSFADVLRRIAHFKMRLGVSLLKSTAEAFSRYLGTVQERMEDTLAEARRARYHTGPGEGSAGVAFWNAVRRAQRGLFDRQRRRDE